MSALCDHPVIYYNLCAVCGEQVGLTASQTSSSSVPIGQASLSLSVSSTEAARRGAAQRSQLLQQRKLSVVLDLDHTLLHCTCVPLANVRDISFTKQDLLSRSTPEAAISFFDLDYHRYFIQIRPFATKLIKKLHSSNYQVYVFTMGTRAYALKCLKILGVLSEIPETHVFSRDDVDPKSGRKTIIRIFPAGTTMTVIVDDKIDVWGSFARVVHQVVPFLHWKGERSVAAELELPPIPKEKCLLEVLELLNYIHLKFFEFIDKGNETNVAEIIKEKRSTALTHCRIYLCEIPIKDELHPLITRAGGFLASTIEESTHLVCGNCDGNVVKCARDLPGLFIVNPLWLYHSLCGLKWCHEAEYLIGMETVYGVNKEFCLEVVEIVKMIKKKEQEKFDHLLSDLDDSDFEFD
ncbi:hypothetical protein P9112_009677 [Eukaryota sp. TZLM1-RC]